MDRRTFIAMVGSGLTASIAGCAGILGEDSDDEPAPESTPTPTPEPTATPDPTPKGAPDFETSIETPNTVEVDEEFDISITVQNNGDGAGTFRSSLSHRFVGEEWDQIDTEFTAYVPAGESDTTTLEDLTIGGSSTYEFRVDETSDVAVIDIVSPDTPNPTPNRQSSYDSGKVRANAAEPSYDEFFRNFEDYQGEPVHFDYGGVYQAIYEDSGDYLQMQISTDGQNVEGDIAAMYYGDERILEDDVIEVWGVAERLYSYETVQGNERTIPLITLVDFELVEE